MCIGTEGLLAPVTCNDESTYVPTTIEGTLTKVWKDSGPCGTGVYRYLIAYDENDLADPTSALTVADIDGVFCKGCLTTWVEDKIQCVAGAQGSVLPYYSNMCVDTTTEGVDSTELLTFDFPESYFTSCGQRIKFSATGEFVRQDEVPEEATGTLTINFGGEDTYILTFGFSDVVSTSGTWVIEGYISRAADQDGGDCFGYNVYAEITEPGEGGTQLFREVDIISITVPDIYSFTINAQVASADSSITLGQVIVDYYDVPVICGETICCDT